MKRRRWPDLVLVLGILALFLGGVWALWGDDIRAQLHPAPPAVKRAPVT